MLRILFAHPDQKLCQIYIHRLNSDFLIDSVYDGLSAVRKARLSIPNLIISDYNLPLLSGISLLRFARNHPQLSTVPFIFLSDHFDNSKALSFGANDWLTVRSCNPNDLLAKVYHHLKINRVILN